MVIDSKELESLLELSEASAELSTADIAEIKALLGASEVPALSPEFAQDVQNPPDSGESTDLRTKMAAMSIPERIKLALFGNSICRGLLIRDTNRMIQQFVLKNAKLTVKEIEEFARNQHLSEFVLREISDSKTWMRSSLVKYNIVTNPKTPPGIALKWLRYLQPHEIRRIAKSKNLPQLIATTAKKLVVDLGD